AEEVGAKLEREARAELVDGAAGRARRLTFAAAGELYASREKPIHPQDRWRILELNEVMGDDPIEQAADGWQRFRIGRARLTPATMKRWGSTAQAVLNHAGQAWSIAVPKLPVIAGGDEERVRWLTKAEQERLLAAYSRHSRPIALTLCYQ